LTAAAKTIWTTRERQVSASQKSANLDLRALDEQKQCLDERPENGVPAGIVLFGPFAGALGAVVVRRSFFCWNSDHLPPMRPYIWIPFVLGPAGRWFLSWLTRCEPAPHIERIDAFLSVPSIPGRKVARNFLGGVK
jgi:hypothetical protein